MNKRELAKTVKAVKQAEAIRLVKSGLTYTEVAEQMNQYKSTIQQWCRGLVKLTRAARKRSCRIVEPMGPPRNKRNRARNQAETKP